MRASRVPNEDNTQKAHELIASEVAFFGPQCKTSLPKKGTDVRRQFNNRVVHQLAVTDEQYKRLLRNGAKVCIDSFHYQRASRADTDSEREFDRAGQHRRDRIQRRKHHRRARGDDDCDALLVSETYFFSICLRPISKLFLCSVV